MNNKKKIAFIIDTDGWTFSNLAYTLKCKLSFYYDIDIIPGDIFKGNIVKLFILCQKYDLIHFLWRGYLSLIDNTNMDNYILSLGFEKDEFYQNYIYKKIITSSVCDHLYLSGEDEWRTNEIFKYVDSYFVTSLNLLKIYSNINKEKLYGIINDFVDLELFKPTIRKKYINDDKIIIGWVGNSKFIGPNKEYDLKGLNTIIKPAINELLKEGYKIELKLADSNERIIPNYQMPDFYKNIDIYVCASSTEGTPMPILEAMAIGLPVVSTNVGIVNEAFGDIQKKLIMKERSINELKNKIKYLVEHKDMLEEISKENIENVKKFSIDNISKKYYNFFESNLSKKK